MRSKVTIIGQAPAAKLEPTRLGDAAPQSPAPTRLGPTPTSPKVGPTSLAGAVAFLEKTTSTVVQDVSSVAKKVTASVLPGIQRKTLDVSLADLQKAAPAAEELILRKAQTVLSSIHLASMDPPAWVAFGLKEQERVAELVKQRLALVQASGSRAIAQHLKRLQELLMEVLSSLDGGFLKKSTERVWTESLPEIQQLEKLLKSSSEELQKTLKAMQRMRAPVTEHHNALEAHAVAGTHLLNLVSPEEGNLLVSRISSLTSSQALLKEHTIYLEQDLTQLLELATLVQDGVLLKLPSVHAQLGTLVGKPSDTERFLSIEKLNEILQHLKK